MSENYLPLFRKYRPQSFADLVGQENLVKALSNAIELKRIANAYLFCGPRGTGKTSSARIFAKSLNCENGPTTQPCQKCASCVDITNAVGMDVIEIDAATNRGVEGAEELIQQVHYAPVGGKYKIFIIDEVHMLSATAFNALLKTFEEPPENVIFILATTEPHKILETIISRCQRFDFRRITIDDITKRLREISDIEKIKITDDALFTIAKNVSGGLRDSLALLDQVSILGAKEEITKETIEELLGKVTFDRLDNLLSAIVNKDIETSLKLMDEIYSKGSEPRNFCENFIEFLRNVTIITSAKNPQDITKFTTLTKFDVEKIVERKYDRKTCERILDVAIEYFKEIKFATNPYLWAELMIIQASKENLPQAQVVQTVVQQAPTQNVTQNTVQKTVQNVAPAPIVQKPTIQKVEEIQPKQEKEAPSQTVKAETQEPIAQKPAVQEPATQTPTQAPTQAPTVQTTTQSTTSSGSELEIWSNIVNSIESIPAKFFYSGMGKLVSICDNKITLAFINQNVITQAKSDMKFNALIQGEKNAYNSTYNFEFIQMSPNVKVIEGNVAKAQQTQPRPQVQTPQNQTAQTQSFEKQEYQAPKTQAPQAKTGTSKPDNDISNAMYSPKVKEMLEAFGGKIID